MSSPFTTEQVTLAQLFSGDHVFSFPAFQRPYRWTKDEALTLVDDVAAACLRDDPGYFLGNLVLTRGTTREAMVIDGRQRLTTLFMLICVLRDLEEDDQRKANLHRLIWDDADTSSGIRGGWRLRFAPAEADVIDANLAGLSGHSADSGHFDPGIQQRYLSMFAVAEAMRDLFSKPREESGLPARSVFIEYLLHLCEVIVLTAASATSGLRLFQVLNNRGLQLSESDLIKPDLLQALPAEQQGRAALIWDSLEDRLGMEQLDVFLRAVVFIISGDWVPAGREFAPSLKAAMMTRGAEAFHFEDLSKYGDAFADLLLNDILYDEPEDNPNLLIQAMNMMGRNENDWKEFIPVAMEIIARYDGEPEELWRHIRALDRAVFVWFILDLPEDTRRKAAFEMIRQIGAGEDLFADGKAFDISDADLDKAIAALGKPVPKILQRSALIRRVELGLCLKEGKTAPQYIELATSSQVLPKTPGSGSQWQLDFTRDQLKDTVDLLGNAVLLTRELDKRIAGRDYNAKRTIFKDVGLDRYFRTVGDVCKHDTWTPEDIQSRTKEIADLLADSWRSIPTEPFEDDEFDDWVSDN